MATNTSTTPTFPTPASARVHPATANQSASGATTKPPVTLTTTPAQTSVPATTAPTTTTAPGTPGTAGTPTTTYVPAGATPLPAGTAGGVPAPAPPSQSTSSAHTLTRAPAKHSETLSTAAIAAAVAAVVLVLACIAWALARQRAFEPHWMLSLRHAMGEAGFRASAVWAEFADWARLGH